MHRETGIAEFQTIPKVFEIHWICHLEFFSGSRNAVKSRYRTKPDFHQAKVQHDHAALKIQVGGDLKWKGLLQKSLNPRFRRAVC